ncbi:UNKNOWN [Stylonychia lemnae]|uniref:Uncharacterized protein n=1 Tax=Stylonychia lemnae TaxID=5949 RepID=A0A078A0V9_STYLE|nr:UNKNOWN [Stylonychia lemnae]|eukprot:CDW75770.1 UNKNOWN [Stylonychia lemnae]
MQRQQSYFNSYTNDEDCDLHSFSMDDRDHDRHRFNMNLENEPLWDKQDQDEFDLAAIQSPHQQEINQNQNICYCFMCPNSQHHNHEGYLDDDDRTYFDPREPSTEFQDYFGELSDEPQEDDCNCGCGRDQDMEVDHGLDSTFHTFLGEKELNSQTLTQLEVDQMMEGYDIFNEDSLCLNTYAQLQDLSETSSIADSIFKNESKIRVKFKNQGYLSKQYLEFHNQNASNRRLSFNYNNSTLLEEEKLLFNNCFNEFQNGEFIYDHNDPEGQITNLGFGSRRIIEVNPYEMSRDEIRQRQSQMFEEEKIPKPVFEARNPTQEYFEQLDQALIANSNAPPTNSHAQNDKYYKKFDFFYKRTCFRLMSEYFKHLFSPYQKIWVDLRKKTSIQKLLVNFANEYFGEFLESVPSGFRQEFLAQLTGLVHSHRHNKKEEQFIVEKPIDFDIIRDTMYKYSKKAQEKFFNIPILCYFFIWFAQSEDGLLFTEEKFADKGPEYIERMRQELDELKIEAIKSLQKKNNNQCTMLIQNLKL